MVEFGERVVDFDARPVTAPVFAPATHEGEVMQEAMGQFVVKEPVVRCRDCRWYTPEFEYEEERGFGCHEKCLEPGCCLNPARCCTDVDQDGRRITVGITTEPDGYCKWGERR